jgi:hypothetical protein
VVAPVPIGADEINLLIQIGQLREADALDRGLIGAAAGRALADAATRGETDQGIGGPTFRL